MKERIPQLDFLKGVFILLMVTFHLSLIDPMWKKAVYTFHMSAFLIISGYLANVEKNLKDFNKGILKILVPYLLFESLYLLMVFFLGKTMHTTCSIRELTVLSFIDSIAEHPIGTYWYLHTLLICTCVYYIVYRAMKLTKMTALIIAGLALYGLSVLLSGFKWSNSIYFLIGVCIMRSGRSFTETIPASGFAVLPLCILFASPDNYVKGSLAGVSITLLVISLLLFFFKYSTENIRRFFCYLGHNSLAIVVFSPIFTVATKLFIPFFRFDPTPLCFLAFSLTFVVTCSLFTAWIFDKIHLSRFIFLKEKIYADF